MWEIHSHKQEGLSDLSGSHYPTSKLGIPVNSRAHCNGEMHRAQLTLGQSRHSTEDSWGRLTQKADRETLLWMQTSGEAFVSLQNCSEAFVSLQSNVLKAHSPPGHICPFSTCEWGCHSASNGFQCQDPGSFCATHIMVFSALGNPWHLRCALGAPGHTHLPLTG